MRLLAGSQDLQRIPLNMFFDGLPGGDHDQHHRAILGSLCHLFGEYGALLFLFARPFSGASRV
ncbi:hypothetical protein [Erwinia sp. E_sp_B01_9]|uniref:hypothetical protein n=1 Tax=Erwinia sp. E_sp_B01_9 TaxID=3039403 RepID=UPI003D9BF105